MKKIFRKNFFAFFATALLVLALSLPVFADMGPKPSVTLKLYYTPGQRYAVTLLGNTEVSGPWGSADQYRERMGSRETWEAFRNYPAPEGYYFLDNFQEYPGDADETFVWGYYPPNKFYVLLYNIETGTFYRSEEPVERYAFAARVLITLILELSWGILLFGLRGTAQKNVIGKVNLATQIILNLGLCYGTLYVGPMWGGFLYIALEVLVFAVEAFVYNRYLPWPEGKKPHPILYALTANLFSFGVGLALNIYCTNTQIRLIGLICLVLWYAGPWLCRKLRSQVQNAQ